LELEIPTTREAHRMDSDDFDVPRGKTSYDVAKRVWISPRTYERVRHILKNVRGTD